MFKNRIADYSFFNTFTYKTHKVIINEHGKSEHFSHSKNFSDILKQHIKKYMANR